MDQPVTSRLEVVSFTLGLLGVNTFLVYDPDSRRCSLIDAGAGPAPVIQRWRELQLLPPEGVVLTHGHADHIEGLDELRVHWPDLRVWISRIEADFLLEPMLNLSGYFGTPVVRQPATDFLEGGETLLIAGQPFEVILTPGHSPGSLSFYHSSSQLLFSGDVLFRGSVGRTDFPTSDEDVFAQTLRRIMALPDQTRVFNGHGGATTIGRERASNPYLRDFGL